MNSFIGSVLYTTYILTLPAFHPAFTYQKSRTFPPPPFTAVFMAGALAGAAQSLVAAPMDSLKIKFQVQDMAHGGKHKSMWEFATSTLRELGLKTVYRGFALTLVKVWTARKRKKKKGGTDVMNDTTISYSSFVSL